MPKAQLTKMQKGGFLRFLAPLLKSGLPLLKSVIKPFGMLWLTAAASATDAAINKKILGSGTTTLIISNDEIDEILKIVKSLEYSRVSLKELVRQLKMKPKKKKEDFLLCYLVHLVQVY